MNSKLTHTVVGIGVGVADGAPVGILDGVTVG